ncbi:RABP1 protein, partial [Polypterus senegalus]
MCFNYEHTGVNVSQHAFAGSTGGVSGWFEDQQEINSVIGVNAMLRKVAVAAASKPHVEIRQNGEKFYIKTSTTVRTTEINFHIGEEFEEETVDGRKCKVMGSSSCGASVGEERFTDLDFGDDAVIFTESMEALTGVLKRLSEESECLGLRVS